MKLEATTRFLNAMSGEILDPGDHFTVKSDSDKEYFVGHGLAKEVKEKESKEEVKTKEDKASTKTK